MVKYYRMNEIVKMTSVSARTLHYYDEISLLKPSYRTASGHRRYSKDDLLKLQQIMTFKFMGFDLTKIETIFATKDFNMHESLKLQACKLSEQAAQLNKVSKLLNYLVDQTKITNQLNWDMVIKIIEALQLHEIERQHWHELFLTTDEIDEFNELCANYSDEFWVDYHKRWRLMFNEVKINLNTDPESYIGLELAKKWLNLVDEIYTDKPHLRSKLWEGYKAGIIPQNQLPYDEAIINYISKAVTKLNESNFYR